MAWPICLEPILDKTGKWDTSEGKCVSCPFGLKSETGICADTSGVYVAGGMCTLAGNNKFESACGAAYDCDEKAVGDNCGGANVCDANGQCVPPTCPAGDFTCQNECTPSDSYRCTGTQLQKCITTCDADTYNDWCNTATAANEAGKCNDGVDNDCDGNTDGEDTTDCSSPTCIAWMGDNVYKIGQTIEMYYDNVTCGPGTFELTDPSSATRKSDTGPSSSCSGFTNAGFMTYNVPAGAQLGTWTVTLDFAQDTGGNSCGPLTATTKVVECFNNSDCAAGEECNASGSCIAIALPPPPGCTPDGCNNTCPGGCTGADDPDCAGGCLDVTCATDTDCGPLPPPPPPPGPVAACNPNAWSYCNPIPTIDTISQAAETFLGYLLGLIGSIALLLIIIAGVMYMTSAGSEDKISTSKRILSGAVIGLGVALLAYSLLQVIISILNAP